MKRAVRDNLFSLHKLYLPEIRDWRRSCLEASIVLPCHAFCNLIKECNVRGQNLELGNATESVSYTHLDVYKRQDVEDPKGPHRRKHLSYVGSPVA